jgi:hypothetical protein
MSWNISHAKQSAALNSSRRCQQYLTVLRIDVSAGLRVFESFLLIMPDVVPNLCLQAATNIRYVAQQSATMYKQTQNCRRTVILLICLDLLLLCIGESSLRHISVLPLRTSFVTSDEKTYSLNRFCAGFVPFIFRCRPGLIRDIVVYLDTCIEKRCLPPVTQSLLVRDSLLTDSREARDFQRPGTYEANVPGRKNPSARRVP